MKRIIKIFPYLLVLVMTLTSFSYTDSRTIEELLEKINELEWEVKYLSDKEAEKNFEYAYFNATDINASYTRVDTYEGMFYVTLEEAKKVKGGYQLEFLIGNPNNCRYNGYNVKIIYNTKYPTDTSKKDEWYNNLTEKNYSFEDSTLFPGAWNRLELIIPESNINKLGFIKFSMSTNTIELKPALNNTSTIDSSLNNMDNNTNLTTQEVINSYIKGDFEGFSNGNLFELDNGQIWKQRSYDYYYTYTYHPKVLIYKDGVVYKMKVSGVDREITVEQIK